MGVPLLPFLFLSAATPMPAGNLIQHPAHFFDLADLGIAFRAGQPVKAKRRQPLLARGEAAAFGRTPLPFAFPFGNKRWTEVYVNLTGCLTFGAPDGAFPYHFTWPDGTMRTRAAQAELAAARGESYMITPLWGVYAQQDARLWKRASQRELVITWDVARFQTTFQGYMPLGRNVFQVRLRATGEIEFRYGEIAERDGFAGVFSGLPATETKIAEGVFDAGSLLHFAIPERALALPAMVVTGNEGTLLRQDPKNAATGLILEGQQGFTTDPMAPASWHAANGIHHFYLPKLSLTTPDRFRWRTSDRDSLEEVRLREEWRFGARLSAGLSRRGGRRWDGSVYEVFHYPAMWKSRHVTFRAIHQQRPVRAEMAVAFTDFRIDDIHNHGSSNGDISEHTKQRWLSRDLLSAAGPVYLGPRFRETIVTPERTYRNHAYGVWWMAHEMIHLWGVTVQHQPPIATGDFHWSPWLETRVVTPVTALFADRPYPEESLMGGMTVIPTGDGRQQSATSGGAATGLSALDLWMMGLLRPGEVPAGHEEMRMVDPATNDFVTIRFGEVVAANRLIAPPPHGFRQAVYVLHENGRPPDPAAMALANGLERSLLRYYEAATQGRMRIRPAE